MSLRNLLCRIALPPPNGSFPAVPAHERAFEPVQDISDSILTACLQALVLFNIAGDVSASVTQSEG